MIGAVRDALQLWAQREGWKHATLVQALVEVHYRDGLDRLTGVDFSRDGDPARVMKTNAERVMRWLDDQTKDTTLMPANLLRTVMAALPLDLRHWLANELLAGVGLTVSLQAEPDAIDLRELLVRVVKEGGRRTPQWPSLPSASRRTTPSGR
ncbi:hypothetical protein BJP62_06425 [Jeongeupia sp. USM3]|nr:hypothetical protein BJP62_06425 [Jeongeupia sp. USM3]